MILESWLSSILNRLRQPKLGSSRRRGGNRSHFAAEVRHLEILEDRALLSAFTVVSSGDAGTGSALSGDIRYCITQADQPTNAGSTITFDTALTGSTITLTHGPLVISDTMTITGPGASSLTTSGNNSSRLFDVDSGGSLTLENVTLSGGLAQGTGAAAEGGAIYSSGTLALSGDAVKSNEAVGSSGGPGGNGANAYGGGIYVAAGSVTLTNDTFSGNKALGGNGGYGAANSDVSGGPSRGAGGSGGAGSGGGLYVAAGTVTLTDDTLSGNNAVGGRGGTGGDYVKVYVGTATEWGSAGSAGGGAGSGGGLYVAGGSVTLTNDTLSGNQATGGDGANGIQSNPGNGAVNVQAGGNGGAGSAGGLYVAAGTVTLTSDTLSGNQATGGNGGAGAAAAGGASGYGGIPGGRGGPGGSGGAGLGGGSYVAGGSVTLSNDTLDNNQAGGGNGGTGGYGSGNGGSGGVGSGGGVSVAAGTVTLSNDTLSGNQAAVGNGGPGGGPDDKGSIGSNGTAVGGGIDNAAGSSSLQIYDTIVANDTAITASPDLDGGLTSLGNNLIGNSTGGSGFAASDLLNVNPQLGPLQNNGGPTQTMALLPGSPAINSGDTADAPAYDQRGPGFPRIVNGSIDIGAFEVQATNVAAPIVSSINTTQGPASGGTSVTITGSNLGTASTATVDFGTGHPATIVSDSGSTIVATSPAGTGTVNVTVTTLGGTSTTSSADQFTYLPLTLSPTSLTTVTANQSYSATITASGGSGSYTYALAPGSSLPAGLTLSNSGTVSGTASTAGSYTFTIVASDTVYAGETGSRQYTLTVNPASTLTLTPASLPNGTAGGSYSPVTISASGGSGSYTYALAPGSSLPPGLTLSNSGTVSGTTSTAGSYTFTIVASDTVYASETGSRQYTLTVNPASTLTLTPTSLPNATVGDSYSPVTITASGGSGSYTFALATGGKLPAGLTLTSAGVLSGTPTTTSGSPFRFTIVATDKSNSHLTGSRAYTLTVDPAITLSPTTLPVATVGDAVDDKLTAKGGSGADYTFDLASGSSLPNGLTLGTAGVITGTPAQSGKYTFTIVATDSIGATASRAYTLTVDPAITLSPTTLPVATVGDAVDDKLTAKGGSGADYTFALASGSSLPCGL
jgi:large repetitive protein